MKRFGFFSLAMFSLLLIAVTTLSANDQTQLDYGSIVLNSNGTIDSGNFSAVWNLMSCDLVISFTYDGNGLIGDYDSSTSHAWSQLGIRSVGFGNFNPTSGSGIWFTADYPYYAGAFVPDPNLDLDDKLLLQKAGGHGEGDYNLPSTPSASGNNHRFWFDRDGVDEYQAQNPLAVNGGTYNTSGAYDVVITLHATSLATGTAYMTINGLSQGFETNGDWDTMELSPAGMTFTGDMANMQIFFGLYGYGADQSVEYQNIIADGCPAAITIGDCVPSIPSLSPEEQWQLYDLIANCEATSENHGDFVSCVAGEMNTLKKAGTITGKEMGSIVSCSAQSDIGND